MGDVTRKNGVEATWLAQIPQLKDVRAVTDHSYRDNAYYR